MLTSAPKNVHALQIHSRHADAKHVHHQDRVHQKPQAREQRCDALQAAHPEELVLLLLVVGQIHQMVVVLRLHHGQHGRGHKAHRRQTADGRIDEQRNRRPHADDQTGQRRDDGEAKVGAAHQHQVGERFAGLIEADHVDDDAEQGEHLDGGMADISTFVAARAK